ncbi:MAG: DNA helicase UvrD, partial [Candidatus Micrarchaeota archaeon]|nr:DNA helicase UvrD [Candidatus Micrarchaeota archaeon]
IETPPAYGKYHWDGHRACNFSCPPEKTRALDGICPKCKKPLVIGVDFRVTQLADRPAGFVPKNAIPFRTLLPLHELASVVLQKALSTKAVSAVCEPLMTAAGSELSVLLDMPRAKVAAVAGVKMADAVMANRAGAVRVTPGFDGEYGKPRLD